MVNYSFALGMAALALMQFGQFMALHSGLEASEILWSNLSLAGQILLPGPWLLFSLTFGRLHPSRHLVRWRLGILAVFLLSLLFLVALASGWLVTASLSLRSAGTGFAVFLVLTLTAVLGNFEGTLRSADRPQRWRIKFLILGLSCIVGFLIYVLSQALLFSSVAPDFSALTATVVLVGCGLITFSLVRHRLLNVDIFVSRYVIYGSFTVVTVGTYLLVMGLLAQATRTFGGDLSSYLWYLAVFLTLLVPVIIVSSYNVRKRIKLLLDRHFYEDKYDYRQEWLRLTERLSSKIDVPALIPPLANTIFETFWIKRTVLWLSDDHEREYRLVHPAANSPEHLVRWHPVVIRALKDLDYPISLDGPADAPDLAVIEPPLKATLLAMDVSILVPLVVETQLVGILGLSRRYAGAPLDREDYDLIKTMGKQAASTFLSARLSQRLLASKELEVFHSLSTFLLHDLKNFVSMLSLVVANMDRNIDNVEFRRDAFASLTHTVSQMKRLMDRLAFLSKPPEIDVTAVDLTDLVAETLVELRASLTADVRQHCDAVPRVLVDRGQLKKVVTNLLLNADEAMTGRGEIQLATAVRDGMVTLSVSDSGCGMSQEFVKERLFKPFATTKTRGFGIGLYQSKTIMEALGGRIDVTTESGRGSTFTISVPIARGADHG